MWGKYLSKSVPDHLSSDYSFAEPNKMKKVKGGHLSRSAPYEARSNIILFNSIGRKHNSSNDLQGDDVVFPLGRSLDDIQDKKRRQINQFRHDDPFF
ncbi:hypothetical protein ACJMK2_013234 [Sinanodonta woodiana]|uniref:Uncharacterized protein n=1 Tax=Sinanodonta woodiana TaxID=1069815 RepID=A0ABD3UWW3_SINWO